MSSAKAAIYLCLLWAASLYSQGLPAVSLKPGRVEGVVLSSATNEPLRKVAISLGNAYGARSYSTVSDAAGRFDFPTVEPGTYVVDSASLTGYIYVAPRARNPTQLSRIAVGENQHLTGIKVFLAPLAAISGSVTDDEGAFLSGVTVQALSNTYSMNGVKQLSVAKSVRTDDRGRYRLYGLTPGHYSIRAIQHAGPAIFGPETRHNIPELAYETTYYPSGGELSQALPLVVVPGSDFAEIDVRLRSVPAFHIRGRVTGVFNGGPFNGNMIAQPCQSPVASDSAEQFTGTVRADGQFDIAGLRSGAWCLSSPVQGPVPPGAPRNTNFFSATVNITSIDVDNLNLTPLPLLDIQGLVRSEAPLTESLKYLRVTLQPERGSGGSPSMKLNDDSTFTLSEVMPDTYRISVSGVPPGSYVKSIDYDRQDASNGLLTVFQGGGTLTIHLAPGTGRLNASVQDESGGSVYQAAIIIAAVSDVGAQSERVRIHYTDENGRAEVLNLPAGDYKTFVIEDNDEDTRVAQSPEFLAEVGVKAVAVTVHANSPASVDLKMLTADEISRIKQKLL